MAHRHLWSDAEQTVCQARQWDRERRAEVYGERRRKNDGLRPQEIAQNGAENAVEGDCADTW